MSITWMLLAKYFLSKAFILNSCCKRSLKQVAGSRGTMLRSLYIIHGVNIVCLILEATAAIALGGYAIATALVSDRAMSAPNCDRASYAFAMASLPLGLGWFISRSRFVVEGDRDKITLRNPIK